MLFEEVQSLGRPRCPSEGRLTSAGPPQRAAPSSSGCARSCSRPRSTCKTVLAQQEVTHEELRSATEETQSSNEELQSTNEELETAKEELQSTNEELTTVNEELQNRNLELSQLNSDLNNLIGSAHIATVMVDNDLAHPPLHAHGRRRCCGCPPRTSAAPSATAGAPSPCPIWSAAVTAVIERLTLVEQEVCDRDGHWYSLRMRPYKTVDNRIDGAVMTLLDIDRLKRSLDEARKHSGVCAEAIVETMREPFLVLDAALHVLTANPAFYATFHVKQEQTLGRALYALGSGQWNIPRLRQFLEEILPLNTHLQDFVMEHDFDSIGHRRMLLNARRISSDEMGSPYILLSIEDITNKQ